jgi:hypothetical protein
VVIEQMLNPPQAEIKKKRGAPFKGQVSDQKEEKFKVQRQQTLRDFKSYYEKRSYLARLNQKPPKGLKEKHPAASALT